MDADTIIDNIMNDVVVEPDGSVRLENRAHWCKKLDSLLSSGESEELQEQLDGVKTCKISGLPSNKCGCEYCSPQEEG